MNPVQISVLRQLERDARTGFAQIGKRIRQSQQRVSYTYNALVRDGVIKGTYALIDYARLGVLSFRVFFRLTYATQADHDRFVAALAKRDDTAWISTCGGSYDLLCTFFASNVSQFNKHLRAIISDHPQIIRSFRTLTTIVMRSFGRSYLTEQIEERFVGGDRERTDLTPTDLTILSQLSADARTSAMSMAQRQGTTAKTVISHLRALEKGEVILGYRPLLDTASLGMHATLLLIRYHNISVSAEQRLIEHLKVHPNVKSVVKTLGEWDLEVETEVRDQKALRRLEFSIRQRFSTLIQDYSSLPLYETHKKTFFPGFLMK